MAVNDFGNGRTVYISGLPYSFENARVLHRSILWSAMQEDSLHKWFSQNINVEVHAFVESGKFCVVNNTNEAQQTVVYKGDGSNFNLSLTANEIKWYTYKT
jgi:1,3-beta-galactosyl-N-acetylhexosamine phosphorylase